MSETATPTTLWVTPVAELGGVARHVLDATRVGIPGWRIIVLCPEGPLAERLRAQGSAVTTGRFGPAAGPLASIRTLRRVARAVHPHIVHSHLAYADIVSAMTPLPRGIRRFTTEHGIAGDDTVYHRSSLQARAMARVHRLRLHRFDGVIAVSRATRDAMARKWHAHGPIAVIPNGVDLPPDVTRRTSESVAGLRILSLSRLAPEKGISELIDAFAALFQQRPDATLTIAGDGPLYVSATDQVDRLGLTSSVTFLGFVDPGQAMAGADVVVQLSVWENCSYTILDAAAQGLRLVASDVGGNSEVVPASSLVAAHDTASVADAIVSAVQIHLLRPRDVAAMCAGIADTYHATPRGRCIPDRERNTAQIRRHAADEA